MLCNIKPSRVIALFAVVGIVTFMLPQPKSEAGRSFIPSQAWGTLWISLSPLNSFHD